MYIYLNETYAITIGDFSTDGIVKQFPEKIMGLSVIMEIPQFISIFLHHTDKVRQKLVNFS